MSDLKNHSRKAEAGISLIDLCIALILISVIMVPMVQQYKQYLLRQEATTNAGNAGIARSAIQRYFSANNKYPLPAIALNKSHANADYGYEAAEAAVCTGTVCYGALPFAALGIPYTSSLDYWGHKLMYAVTRDMTVAPAEAKTGKLIVRKYDQATSSSVTEFSSAHFVVYTAGKDGAGAYTADGKLVAPCMPVAGFVTRESENCDLDNTFYGYGGYGANDFAVNTRGSAANNADYYDDYLKEEHAPPRKIWAGSSQSQDIVSMVTNIGINTATPEVALDVNGDIKTRQTSLVANDGKILSEKICDTQIPQPVSPTNPSPPSPGYNCFEPEAIGADISTSESIHCPPGQAMTGIANGEASCISVVQVVKAANCKNGQIVIGIDAAGKLKCKAYP